MLSILVATLLFSGPLDAKIASIMPTKEEDKWFSIPWRTNLMRARKESQETGKPMFWWIMNGHPLGCT
jgi:hypothetical protein